MKDYYLITGTSSGLGLAFAQQLLEQGNVVCSISRKEKDSIKALKKDDNFHHYNCDLANEEQLNQTLITIFEAIELVSLNSITLINNAGTIHPIGNVGTNSAEEVSNSIDTNLKAPIQIAEYFIRVTQSSPVQKHILNISSGAGRKPYAGWASYCAAKAGLDLFTACIGVEQEQEKYPVKVISFAPGVVDTNMQVTIRKTPKETFDSVNRFIDLKENGQLLPPKFVAHKLLELLPSNKTIGGELYDIRDFIQEKQ
jgi:benzil reductase ((S)-benzoin forming)